MQANLVTLDACSARPTTPRCARPRGRSSSWASAGACSIIRNALFAGATRYNDFRTLGIATNILKSRLDGFVDAGIMERRPERHEYLLTDKGRELASVIVALTEWGDRWAAPDGPPILYTHSVCGGPISLQTTCATCDQVHDPAEIHVRPGPGMPTRR